MKLWNSYIDVIPSLRDYNKVEGLCGTLDNDCSNDFMLPDGSFSTDARALQATCDRRNGMSRWFHPNDFSSAWRYVDQKGSIPTHSVLLAHYVGVALL